MADPGFEERFFRRQRAEILDRLDDGVRTRPGSPAHARSRRGAGARHALPFAAALPLAAALLLVALLAGVVAVRGPGPGSGRDAGPGRGAGPGLEAGVVAADPDGDWLFAWDLPPEMDGAAPLDAFGPTPDASERVLLDPAAALDAVLPPLELEEEDNG